MGGFTKISRLTNAWTQYYVQKVSKKKFQNTHHFLLNFFKGDRNSDVCFIRILSFDGRFLFDFTTDPREGENCFEIVWSKELKNYTIHTFRK